MESEAGCRRFLQTVFKEAVKSAHPETCLEEHLPQPPKTGRIILLAGGKAAGKMMEVAYAYYRQNSDEARLEGVAVPRYGGSASVFPMIQIEAGHPVPDENSVAGARKALELAEGAREGDLVLVLLSGGASALWSAPVDGVTLAQKQLVTRQLLRSGAPIQDMNCVRKHLSRIKGGRLAKAAAPAHLVTLSISDVVGDDPAVIGSGPTIGDPTTLEDARAIIEQYGIELPQSVKEALEDPANETPKTHDLGLADSTYQCIANGATALARARTLLEERGFRVVDLGDGLEGEARNLAAQHGALALEYKKGGEPVALMSGGELTVTMTGAGQGGPMQEYMLALAIALDGAPHICALAGDTDGMDGGTGKVDDPAGAFLFPSTLERAQVQKLNPATFLEHNDSGTFFGKLDDLLRIKATCTNVNDLRIILVNGVL